MHFFKALPCAVLLCANVSFAQEVVEDPILTDDVAAQDAQDIDNPEVQEQSASDADVTDEPSVAAELQAQASVTVDDDTGDADPAASAIAQSSFLPDDIQSDGAFRYRIPIQIPSFRGLEPNLALVYNSSQKLYADEGAIAGVGWSMTGLSSIERVSIGGGIASFIDGEDIYRIDGQDMLAEFVARAVQDWIKAVGTKTAYIEPGSPHALSDLSFFLSDGVGVDGGGFQFGVA